MSRVALLIGVSRYPTGLDPLPDVQKDVEVLRRVLKQPQLRFESVQSLCDRPLQVMQETIERFFRERASDDQLVFLFGGYTLQDVDGRLYFATPSTTLEAQGAIANAQTITASSLQAVMNSSPAKQQVLILETYSLETYSEHIPDESAVAEPPTAEPVADLVAQLGGSGRVILAASGVNRHPPSLPTLDVWTYTRYLAEGIETGAADRDDDGILTAADVHHYAAHKLQIAAPALEPQMYGSTETAQSPLLEVPTHDPRLHYRKVLETAADAISTVHDPVLERRSLLNDIRHSLGLSPHEAIELEAAVLRPAQEYCQRVALYQEQVDAYARSPDADSDQHREALKQWRRALYLNDQDVAMVMIVPTLGERQQDAHDQETLTQYQHILLQALQRQYPQPLQESDRRLLHRLQQTLQLRDDDVKPLEAAMLTQAEQFTGTVSTPLTATDATAFSTATSKKQTSTDRSPAPTLSEAVSLAPAENSRAKDAILQRLFNVTDSDRLSIAGGMPTPARLQASEHSPSADALPNTERSPSTPPARDESLSILPNAQPNPMDRIRRSASNYQALIIPAILLAAIIGLMAAILPSTNRPNWFKFGQTPADPAAAQRFNSDGLRKTQAGYNKAAIDDYTQAIAKNPNDASAYMNRGVAHHRLGNTGAAVSDYEQALKLDPKSALLYSNLSYAYYDRQNYDKALEAGNQAVALNGNLAQAHINLANARAKKADYDAALQDYAQAIALRPSASVLAGAYNNRGNIQLALNKTSEALSDYSRAIRLQSDYADAYYNLGLAQQALGNRTAAIRSLQTAAAFYQKQNKEALQKEATDRATALQKGNS